MVIKSSLKRKTKQYVGELRINENDNTFVFEYDKKYLYADNIIPIGPELSLARAKYVSEKLFPSFKDRIPSRENPAYAEYCQACGITVDEKNPLVLLVTIGRRGPSSFVFSPRYQRVFTHETLSVYRAELALTAREFGVCFELSPSTLIKIERGQLEGREILRRLEIYWRFPEVARYQVLRCGGALSEDKQRTLIMKLR